MKIASMEKLTIIKVGGKIVENEDSLQFLLKEFAKIKGYKILVHGGGSLATKIEEKLGLESKMVNGRRITDKETLKIVTMVYAGLVNKNIVAQLQGLGLDAIGLTGADMNIILSEKRPVKDIDYGFVGDVKEVSAEKLFTLLKHDLIPVLAPLTHDGKGSMLNTNADTIAAETAKALSSSFDVNLVYCFEKAGVLMNENDESTIIPEIDATKFEQLVNDGIINGGMIPKLENAFESINNGVKTVIITKAENIAQDTGTRIN